MANSMESQGIAARIGNLRKRAGPLIDWYRANKPKVKTLRVTGEEFKMLVEYPDIAERYGFSVSKDDKKVTLENFEVLSSAPAN